MSRRFGSQNQNNLKSPDGRQHPRVVLELPVEYHTHNQVPRPGHTYNLSRGGVMLNLPEKLPVGQGIQLAIFFSLGAQMETIQADSRVVWVSPGEKEGSYRSGAIFTHLSQSDEGKLHRFFDKF